MLILYQKQRLKPVRRDTGKFDETPEIKTNKTIMISMDDSLTAYLCNSAVGFLAKFKDHGKEEMAEPAGSGAFVQLDTIKGILTAGHVIDKLPRKSGQMGLIALYYALKIPFRICVSKCSILVERCCGTGLKVMLPISDFLAYLTTLQQR